MVAACSSRSRVRCALAGGSGFRAASRRPAPGRRFFHSARAQALLIRPDSAGIEVAGDRYRRARSPVNCAAYLGTPLPPVLDQRKAAVSFTRLMPLAPSGPVPDRTMATAFALASASVQKRSRPAQIDAPRAQSATRPDASRSSRDWRWAGYVNAVAQHRDGAARLHRRGPCRGLKDFSQVAFVIGQ